MKTLTYRIEFFSNWHCGSGQAAGADVDELTIKDRDGLPFIPGRTVKGLLLDACNELSEYDELSQDEVKRVFGYFDDKPDKAGKGTAFFSDATIPDADRQVIIREGLQPHLFQSVSATAIDNDGIAKNLSLRKIQTTVPCILEGTIQGVPDGFVQNMKQAFGLVKRLGLGRSHGLGRCKITLVKED